MTATGDTFATATGSGGSIQVGSGGHLKASNSTFNLNSLSINNASVYASGDMAGDTFNMPIYVPYGDVQYLAGNAKFEQVYINAATLPSGQTLALNQIGTNASNLEYVFSTGGFTIASGATLNVAANVPVLLTDGQTITDNGTLTFASGDTMDLDTYYGASQIVVNGTMTATGDTFATATGSGGSIQVGSGGHLKASSSTFNLNSLSISSAAVYASGDMASDTFNTPIYVPYGDVQYLSGNAKFEQVYINAATLPSGQTLALNQIGTNTSSLEYVFSTGGFTIASGATLNVAANVPVLLTDGQTLTDNGALTFAGGATMDLNTYYGASQIVVNGTMTATGDTFATATGSGGSIQVGSGGHLKASSSTFNLNSLSINNASVYASGDMASDTFNMPIYVPYGDVQYLAGNAKFEQIYINAGTLPSGQTLALNLIGTNTSSLEYVFSTGGFTIASGGTLNVAANVPVLLTDGQTISDNGTLNFSTGDTLDLDTYYGASQVVVNGTMTATGATFATATGSGGSIQVGSGGHLKASSSVFNLNSLSLNNASILNSGDLSGDTFNMPIYVPYNDVQYLGGNASFEQVYINASTLPSGQELSLNRIGSTSSNLEYVFSTGGFTIAAGAALSVAANVPILLTDGQTLTDNGTLSFSTGDVMNFDTYYGASQIVVNGTMTAADATFSTLTGSGGSVQVNSGGTLNASNSTFGVNGLDLYAGSSGQLAADNVNTVLAINSGTTASVTGSNFSNGTVNASGDSTATITLTNNYWGTTTSSQIAAKITDHHVNSSLPTVNYTPYLSAASPLGAATTIVASSTTATYNANSSQSVTLSAAVTSGSVKPNAGTVTFILVNGTSMIGNPVTATVSSGSASATILLPAGTHGATDTILAIYDGTASYLGSIDASHTVTVNPATVTNTAASVSDTYNASAAQTVSLSATVTSSNGTVNEGTETFTILNGSTPVGSAVTVNVVNGSASATYSVPAGTNAGTYTIDAVYNGTADFKSASDTTHTLTVSAAATTTTSANTSITYSASSQSVGLTAMVTSPGGTVNQATVTFTILSGSTTIGSPVSVSVTNGSANANYPLPQGLAGGTYTIKAVYAGGQDFQTSSDSSHTLTIGEAVTTITAAYQTTTFSTSAQTVTLTATVTSPAGTVGEGSVTFTVLNGTTVIGSATTGNVAGGKVSVNYNIPASEPVGTYTIKAVYSGTAEYMTATDTAHTLTIGAATAIVTPTITPTAGPAVAAVSQNAQPSYVGTTADVVGVTSSPRKPHRAGAATNRGPLSLSRAATHRRSGHHATVADRRIEPTVRPGHRG
jgi:uncharacterized protein YlbG (UPF0298 family)